MDRPTKNVLPKCMYLRLLSIALLVHCVQQHLWTHNHMLKHIVCSLTEWYSFTYTISQDPPPHTQISLFLTL